MALPKCALLYVSERDVDLLLLEELSVSRPFGRWFARRAGLRLSDGVELVAAWHSVTDATLGASDLVVLWLEPDGLRVALLIEDKIEAPAALKLFPTADARRTKLPVGPPARRAAGDPPPCCPSW